ncbi:MAG: hypothetical protein ACRCV9_08675 [Burkholderiaceae bacterium]
MSRLRRLGSSLFLLTSRTALQMACLMALPLAAQAQVVTSCPAGLESTQLISFSGAPSTFTVPANVRSVRIIAVGADGGERTATNFAGGAGARAEGTFTVTPGQVITSIAGGAGAGGDLDAGGGGASGAYIGTTLAVIAGGGGGDDNTGNGGGGTAALAGGNGTPVAPNSCPAGALGGTGGAGGQFGELGTASQACQNGNGGAGGGGLNSPGGSSAVLGIPPARRGATGGGQCSIAGAAGGQGGIADPTDADNVGVAGGFGICGGGGSDHRESGGGGGYSGGGGGPEGGLPGGGGSFVDAAATTPTLTAGASGGGTGRNGSVRLCYTLIANVSITKSNSVTTLAPGTQTTYTITVANNGAGWADGTVLRDPAVAGLSCPTATCGSATGGATCPAPTGAALASAMQSVAGAAIPSLPPSSSLTFTLTCSVN